MSFNWVDFILLAILAITLVLGLIKGLVRQVIGLLAVIAGLILALFYYPYAAEMIMPLVGREAPAQFLGFLAVFLLILCVGWFISSLFSKLLKGPFKFINHLMGGVLGLVKGVLICGVIVFAMLVFPVQTEALKQSRLAPACLYLTKTMVNLIPRDLREDFKRAYQDIMGEKRGDDRRI